MQLFYIYMVTIIYSYDVGPDGLLANVNRLTRIDYGIDQLEEIYIEVFAARINSKISSVFWVWKSADFLERESYVYAN